MRTLTEPCTGGCVVATVVTAVRSLYPVLICPARPYASVLKKGVQGGIQQLAPDMWASSSWSNRGGK